MAAGMSMSMDMPVQTIMMKAPGATPVKYCVCTFNYTINAMAGKIVGDPIPKIKEYSAAGWSLKGALNLPAEMTGMSMRMPVKFFFMAPAADAVAVAVADVAVAEVVGAEVVG